MDYSAIQSPASAVAIRTNSSGRYRYVGSSQIGEMTFDVYILRSGVVAATPQAAYTESSGSGNVVRATPKEPIILFPLEGLSVQRGGGEKRKVAAKRIQRAFLSQLNIEVPLEDVVKQLTIQDQYRT